MAIDYTAPTFSGGLPSAVSLNSAFADIETALAKAVSIEGTSPNALDADFDLNGNDLLNVGGMSGVVITSTSTVFTQMQADIAANVLATYNIGQRLDALEAPLVLEATQTTNFTATPGNYYPVDIGILELLTVTVSNSSIFNQEVIIAHKSGDIDGDFIQINYTAEGGAATVAQIINPLGSIAFRWVETGYRITGEYS